MISYSFEVEIEFKTNSINMAEFERPIKYILKLLKPERFSFMDETSENLIRKLYIDTISPILYNSKINKIDFIYENKPKDFELENIKDFNHSITNKLNGVNYFLYYNYKKNFISLINQSTVEFLGHDITNNLKSDVLIQGELYHDLNTKTYTYYIFDVLKVNNKNNIVNLIHKERLGTFNQYYQTIEDNLKRKFMNIKYKIFYGLNNDPNDNYYDNLIQCLHSMANDNNVIDYKINDGLIFTPLDKYYKNTVTYKYKFPETLTIDFRVKFIRKVNEDIDVYGTYVNISDPNKNHQIIPDLFEYNGNKYVLLCDKNKNPELCKQIKDDDIVECHFDKNQLIFTPERIRHDKKNPNFVSVAQKIFRHILNPIELDKLIEIFKNTFDKSKSSSKKPISLLSRPDKLISNIDMDNVDTYVVANDNLDLGYIESNNINITLKIKLNSLIECVLFSVSPEYRSYDSEKKNLMLKIAKMQFNDNQNTLNNIKSLADAFNIDIYILEPLVNNKYHIIDRTFNKKYEDNKLCLIKIKNEYELIGYNVNNYEVYIY